MSDYEHYTHAKFFSDPVEAEAVSRAFFDGKVSGSKPNTGKDPLYVGSIKTVLGHTEGYVPTKNLARFMNNPFWTTSVTT